MATSRSLKMRVDSACIKPRIRSRRTTLPIGMRATSFVVNNCQGNRRRSPRRMVYRNAFARVARTRCVRPPRLTSAARACTRTSPRSRSSPRWKRLRWIATRRRSQFLQLTTDRARTPFPFDGDSFDLALRTLRRWRPFFSVVAVHARSLRFQRRFASPRQ